MQCEFPALPVVAFPYALSATLPAVPDICDELADVWFPPLW